MENWENWFFQNANLIEDKAGYKWETITKGQVKELVEIIRLDTLRQVLPEMSARDKEYIIYTAKELWGIDLIN